MKDAAGIQVVSIGMGRLAVCLEVLLYGMEEMAAVQGRKEVKVDGFSYDHKHLYHMLLPTIYQFSETKFQALCSLGPSGSIGP